jgi:hypothetical protein
MPGLLEEPKTREEPSTPSEIGDSGMPSGRRPWLSGPACGVLVGIAVLACLPFANMGFIDDWSYVRTAYDFARSGHFIYNGWATAMLGWQIVWSAPFLKLFGYSFTVTRLSMLPFAIGSAWMFHTILRRFGMNNRNAVFGTLTFCLSPVFIPLAGSYMTDIGGVFVILLCIYLCQRALDAKSDRAAVMWLSVASLTNVVGGTERQIAWLGALVLVPSAAWLLRRRRGVVAAAAILWISSVVLVFWSIHWFDHQLYAVPEKILYPPPNDPSASMAVLLLQKLQTGFLLFRGLPFVLILLKAALCIVLLLLPVLIAWLVRAKELGRGAQARLASVVVLLGVLAWILSAQHQLEDWVMPWLYHVLDSEAILQKSWDMLGNRAVELPLSLRVVMSMIVIVSAVAFAEWFFAPRRRVVQSPGKTDATGWETLAILFMPFCTAYLLLLLPRGFRFYLFDRYLLGVMPIGIICLLKLYQERIRESLPVVSYVTLAVFGLYGILATHDLFSLNRARVTAVMEVRIAGIPKDAVQAGFEYDGWTEIDEAHYVNEPKIFPARAFHPNPPDPMRPPDCRLGFDQYTPALHPQYIIVLSPMWCLQPSNFAPVIYKAWLPPFTRQIYVQKVPGNLQALAPHPVVGQ